MTWPHIWVPAFLLFLVILNACFSLDPETSGIRGVVLAASGLGGYGCSRLLLDTRSHRIFFQYFCIGVLILIIGISLKNAIVWGDISQSTPWNVNRHVVTDLITLLSFAPLTLIMEGSRRVIISGISVLGLCFLVLCLSGGRSAVLIPIGLAVLACVLRGLRLRYALPIVAVMAAFTVSLYHRMPPHELAKDCVRVYYWIEAYPLKMASGDGGTYGGGRFQGSWPDVFLAAYLAGNSCPLRV